MFGLLAQTPDGDPLCAEYGELGFAVYPPARYYCRDLCESNANPTAALKSNRENHKSNHNDNLRRACAYIWKDLRNSGFWISYEHILILIRI